MTEKFRVFDGEIDLEREDVRDSQNRRAEERARTEGRSVSDLAREALERYLAGG